MDQEQEQTPEAPQPEVQPAVDAIQPTEVTEPVITPVEAFGPPVESIPQAESAPINPFAAPEVSEPVAIPVSTEPTPAMSPFAAAPQVEEVSPVFSTTPAPTPVVKKSHMGLIIGLVVGLVVLLAVAGVAGYIWFTNFYVAKADYQKAATAYTMLSETDTSIAVMSGSNVLPNDLDSKVDLFNTQAESMGTLKAVQKDATVKSAYDAFVPNYKEEVTFLHAVAELLRATDTCKQVSSAAVKLDTCVSGLRAVKDKGSAPVTAYANTFADYLEAAGKGQSSSYLSAQTNFEKATKDLQAKVENSSIVLRDAINNKLK